MSLDQADHNVLAATLPANPLAQHVVGLADPWGISQKQFEDPLLLLGTGSSNHCSGVFGISGILLDKDYNVESARICHVKRAADRQTVRFFISAAVVCAITAFYFRLVHVNPTTVGFTFLLVILIGSAAWGLRYAIFAAILSTLAYNYFFLPPLFRFSIADPQNWIALFAFLCTAIIGSQLSERARREALKSNQRRREVERLYSFSEQLLVSENVFELLNAIPRYIVESFGVSGAAMFLEKKRETYYFDVSSQSLFPVEQLKAIGGRGEPVLDRERGLCFMPLRMGVRSVGSLGLSGCDLSRESLEAIGSLAATAIERASTIEKLTKTEAARESDRLRSVLLDSVTHEFRTPLTAIKASAETLLSDVEIDKLQRKDLSPLSMKNATG